MSVLPMMPEDASPVPAPRVSRRSLNLVLLLRALGWTGWLLIAIVLGAAALRFYHLGTPSLWRDELDQATVAQQPLTAILDGVRQHPGAAPLDYLLTALMLRVSNAEGVLRFPAALWGMLSVYWLFRLGRRWNSSTACLIAAALLAASVLHLRYSQEVGFYSLFVFLTLTSTEALDSALRLGRWRNWLLYGTLVVLMIYTHYSGVLMLAFQAVWVLALSLEGRNQNPSPVARSHLVRFMITAAAAVLAFLPWLFFAGMYERSLPALTSPMLAGDGLRTNLLALGRGNYWLPLLWALLAVLGFAALWRRHQISFWQRGRANAIFMAVWALLSLPLVIFIDQALGEVIHIGQVLFVLPPCFLLVGAGVSALAGGGGRVVGNRWGAKMAMVVRRALLIVVTTGLLASSWPQAANYFQDQERPEDWRSLGALLSNNLSLDDAAVLWRAEPYVGFYSSRAVQQAHDLASLAELEQLYATGRPLWVLITPYLDLERGLDADAIRSWLEQQPVIVFDLGAGFKLHYLQANHDIEALWQVAQHFEMPAERPDLWTAYAKQLSSLDTEAALNAFVLAAAREQDNTLRASYLFRAGNIALRRRDYDQANQLFDQALAAQPDLSEAYLRKGFALLESGQPQAALAALTVAHERYGRDDYWVHRWLGIALSRLDRPAEALPHYLTALDRSPDVHELRFLIGEADASLGNKADAEKWLQEYLARDPGGVWVQEAQRLLSTLPE